MILWFLSCAVIMTAAAAAAAAAQQMDMWNTMRSE
jgi:hypothetical protein